MDVDAVTVGRGHPGQYKESAQAGARTNTMGLMSGETIVATLLRVLPSFSAAHNITRVRKRRTEEEGETH